MDRIKQGGVGPIATIGLGASVLFSKMKYVFVALKLTKMLPLASMVLSAGAYAMFFGWPYATGMVGLIFIHEAGHALAMKRYGIEYSPMVFVPFMGAVIGMKSQPMNAHQEAMVALSGPLLGSAGALALTMAAPYAGGSSQLCYALADWGYMINLFNLLPIGQMDGGRITGAISPWIGVGGVATGAWLAYTGVVSNPIFYLILLSGTWSTGQRLYERYQYQYGTPYYYRLSAGQKTEIAALYLGLIGALLYAMKKNNERKKTPLQLRRERDGYYSDTWIDTWVEDNRDRDHDVWRYDDDRRW